MKKITAQSHTEQSLEYRVPVEFIDYLKKKEEYYRESWDARLRIAFSDALTELEKYPTITPISKEEREVIDAAVEYRVPQPTLEIFSWLLGYTDFPERQTGQGAYWWRSVLREKLKDVGIKVLDAKEFKCEYQEPITPITKEEQDVLNAAVEWYKAFDAEKELVLAKAVSAYKTSKNQLTK